MNKVYPRDVIVAAEYYVSILKKDGFFRFFNEDEKSNTEYALKYFKEILLEKFINSQPLEFGDDEDIEKHLDKIIAGTLFYEMKKNGYADSYEDEYTKEIFFLTEKGKAASSKKVE